MFKIISNKDNLIKIVSSKVEKFMVNELIIFDNKYKGFIFNCTEKEAHVFMLEDASSIKSDVNIKKTNKFFSFDIPNNLLGKVFDYNMNQINLLSKENQAKIKPAYNLEARAADLLNIHIDPVESKTNIDSREPVNEPLITGKLLIDAVLPIGKGQRQLIIGDRRTGKTSVVLSAILAQKNKNVFCVYVSIGNKKSNILDITKQLEASGALEHTVIISSLADDTSAAQFITPYIGMSIAEKFQREGKDVLIIFDDLSKHARSYRAVSLVSGSSAGREGYPGDVFYMHSKLLERSGNFNEKFNGGSITALPIMETQLEDLSNYISTNLISITDGQIFTSISLFNSFIRPAINVPFSVSRVGGHAQHPFIKAESGSLKNIISQAIQILKISIGDNVGSTTNQEIIKKYNVFTQLSIQKVDSILDQHHYLIFLILLNKNMFDSFLNKDISEVKKLLLIFMETDELALNLIKFVKSQMSASKIKIDQDLIRYYVQLIFGPFLLWIFKIIYKDNKEHRDEHLKKLSKYDNKFFDSNLYFDKFDLEKTDYLNSIEKTISIDLNLQNNEALDTKKSKKLSKNKKLELKEKQQVQAEENENTSEEQQKESAGKEETNIENVGTENQASSPEQPSEPQSSQAKENNNTSEEQPKESAGKEETSVENVATENQASSPEQPSEPQSSQAKENNNTSEEQPKESASKEETNVENVGTENQASSPEQPSEPQSSQAQENNNTSEEQPKESASKEETNVEDDVAEINRESSPKQPSEPQSSQEEESVKHAEVEKSKSKKKLISKKTKSNKK